jgi:hypothetical protein
VRDPKSNAIDPAIVAGPTARTADLAESDFTGTLERAKGVVKIPDGGKIKTLYFSSGGLCNFKEPVKRSLTFKGKTMNLVFNMPTNWDRHFLVDSLPFQPGTFEITLQESSFYPRERWKKLP